jgi:hypothetical protein
MHAWPCEGVLSKAWHQLQNELQMVLHDLEINDERAATRRLVVNSVVLSGAGPRCTTPNFGRVVVDEGLRHAQPGSAAWVASWQRVETHHVPLLLAAAQATANANEPSDITLAGRCRAITLSPALTPAAPASPSWLPQWLRKKPASRTTAGSAANTLQDLLQGLDQDGASSAAA